MIIKLMVLHLALMFFQLQCMVPSILPNQLEIFYTGQTYFETYKRTFNQIIIVFGALMFFNRVATIAGGEGWPPML